MWKTLIDDKPAVDHLTNKTLSNLLMPEDSKYSKDGKVWKCAVESVEKLYGWFTNQDIQELLAMNFKVIKFESEDYIEEENQILFNYNSMVNIIEITDQFQDL